MALSYINEEGNLVSNCIDRREFRYTAKDHDTTQADLADLPLGVQITTLAVLGKNQPLASIFTLMEQGWKDEHGFYHSATDILAYFDALATGGFQMNVVID